VSRGGILPAREPPGPRLGSPREVVSYLADHGLAPAGDGVSGVVVEDRSSQQVSYLVRWPSGEGYVVKQARTASQALTLRHEVTIYRCLGDLEGFRFPAPRLVHADLLAGLLVLRAVTVSGSCDPVAIGSRRALAGIARRLARALASLHRLPPWDGAPGAPLPPGLRLDRPPVELRAHLGTAAADLLRSVQADAVLCSALARGRATWRRSSWIHGELKWPHCLPVAPARPRGRASLYLIDFESAGIGDPAWDAGCVIAAYLSSWLGSMSGSASGDAETLICAAGVPLPDVQQAVGAFWDTYAARRGLPPEQRGRELATALLYAVARLLWNVVEACVGQESLEPRSVLLLQLAHNLADRPDDALSSLLGLSP
jgi:aminoglycoside phosphotransferase (APT) family kinase protein